MLGSLQWGDFLFVEHHDFVLLSMARHADREMTIMKGVVFTHSFLEIRSLAWYIVTWGSTRVPWRQREEGRRKLGKFLYYGFHGKK